MNHIYRSIWNDTSGTFVAASEYANSAGKKASTCKGSACNSGRFAGNALAISIMLSCGASAFALPAGGVVAAGAASINTGSSKTTITQSTQNAVINWLSFNIAPSETVRFIQPDSSSVVLNRVLGADPSNILGGLSANGHVFLVNPNGVLFGKGASVNVGGLVASTLNIADADFMAGKYLFSGDSSAMVINQGSITADGGYVALLGADVDNQGVIAARLGTVALAAGHSVTLDLVGDGLLTVAVNTGAVNALVKNGGLIQADGGSVLLTAQAAGSLLQSAVNNTGVIQAQSVQSRNGIIRLMGGMVAGTVNVGGTLDVSGNATGQTGGNIIATAEHVGLFGAHLNASGDAGGGTVLIGGDFQGKNSLVQNAAAAYVGADSGISADAITQGNGGKVIVWANDSTRAYGTLSARGGSQGGDGGLIETSGHYLDVNGISASASAPKGKAGTWLLDPANIIISGAATTGATLIGSVFAPDAGLGAAVINAGALLGTLNAGTDVTITTTNNGAAGGAIGNITVNSALIWGTAPGVTLALNAANDLTINSAMTASTAADKMLLTAGHDLNFGAALVASAINTRITLTAGNDILATAGAAAVTATGLGAVIDMSAGHNVSVVAVTADGGGAANSVILRANNDVSVNGALSAAGGNVLLRADSDGTGPGLAGGTVKFAGPGAVVASTNTAIRFNPNGYPATVGEIAAYTVLVTGALDAKAWVFGKGVDKAYDATPTATLLLSGSPAGVTLLPGTANFNTKDVGVAKPITFSGYATGGPAGYELWGPYASAAGSGTTTADITAVPLIITANADSKSYNGVPYSGGNGVIYTSFVGGETSADLGGVLVYGGTSQGAVNAGSYAIVPSGQTSSNYTISYVNGNLDVNPAALVLAVTASDVTKPFGQSATLSAFTSVGLQGGDTIGTVTLSSPGSLTGADVATYVITPSDARGGTFVPGNYTISYVNGALTVIPAALTVTANNASKPYGQTIALPVTAFTTAGLVNGDTVTSVTETSPGTVATASVASSAYPISPSGATGTFLPGNYSISYVNGALSVTPVALTVTANNATKPYGQTVTLPVAAFTSTGLVNGDTITSVTASSPGTIGSAPVAGNPYVITPSGATGGTFAPGNYTIAYVNGALTVTPVVLTVTANTSTKPYGQIATLPVTAFTSAGLVNGDTITSVTESSPGTLATAAVAGSPYVITPSGATGTFVPGNYVLAYVNGVLMVTPAPLTVTANNVTKPYGQTATLPLTAYTTTGLVNGDTVTSVTETSAGTLATAGVADSPYPVTPSGAAGTFLSSNYTIGYVNGLLTVTPIPLTVKANDVTKTFGEVPILSGFTTSALVNGETVGGVTESSAGQRASAVPGGTYPIAPSDATGGTFTPSNYTIAYTDGALTVTNLPGVMPPENPFEGPVVTPGVEPPAARPVIAPPLSPPELVTLAPRPVEPVVVAVALPAEKPVLALEPKSAPVIVPVQAQPERYVAPHRPRKQDRN
jgi:filamentous hemagglutinin family protein